MNDLEISSPGSAPIGVFDSGIGGISVLRHIHQLLPLERLLYCADSDNAPYGSKPASFIRARSQFLANFLLERGAKALVVACNTATASAISTLRAGCPVPVIGMEPAVKPAALATKTGVIGVLATSGTLQSARFAALLASYGQKVKVVTQACHGLVECIERGELSGAALSALIARYLQPLLQAGADTIVLGCTHYPFVRPLIEARLSPSITLIDTGTAVAMQLQRRLQAAGLLSQQRSEQNDIFWINRQDERQYQQSAALLSLLWADEQVSVLRLP